MYIIIAIIIIHYTVIMARVWLHQTGSRWGRVVFLNDIHRFFLWFRHIVKRCGYAL